MDPRRFGNLNYRSLEDDKDFEACVLVDGAEFAKRVNLEVRDVDVEWCKRVGPGSVDGLSIDALRVRVRDPRTLLMLAAREL